MKSEVGNRKTLQKGKEYINLLHDWGFKYIFKRESHKDLLIRFLNGIFNGSRIIKSIEYRDTDLQGLEEDRRNSSLDILCTDQNGDRYAIEIQCNAQKYYVDRALFYASSIYARSGKKGEWDYSVKDVVSINILNFALKDDEKFQTEYVMTDTEDQNRRIGKIRLVFLQVPRISDTFDGCKTMAEKWIFGLKNISTMKHYESLGELKEDFKRILELADKAALTEKDRLLYEQQEKNLRDIVNQVEYAEENGIEKGIAKGIEKGREEGMEKGRIEEKKDIATTMKHKGMSPDLISEMTGLSTSEIEKL